MNEFDDDKHDIAYYNRVLEADMKKKHTSKTKVKNANISFSKQNVNFKNYLYVPKGFEFIFYSLYFISIPYIVGAIFLFFSIAGADMGNFKLLSLSTFYIVWAIGYEIVATVILLSILVMYLKYDDSEDY